MTMEYSLFPAMSSASLLGQDYKSLGSGKNYINAKW